MGRCPNPGRNLRFLHLPNENRRDIKKMKNDFTEIQREIDAMQPDLIRIRRDLHRHPETGWLEMRTTAILAKELRALGYEIYTGRAVCREGARLGLPDDAVLAAHAERALTQGAPEEELTAEIRAGYTGVIALLRCGEGPTVAMRFDIDALPMTECPLDTHRPTREGFASENPGMMHACGHDGHAAIGLGVARILMAHRDALHGTVKLIFQPAEEGVRGAHAIVENGWLDDADVLLASHVAPTGKSDDGDVTAGTWGSLATTKYDVAFIGRAAHAGGFPEQGKNALLASASAALALHAIPRHGGGRSFINVGTLRAGSGRNVVPDHALMQLEVRGETTEINQFMMERTEEICQSAAAMQGCACELTLMGMAESQHSDERLIERIGKIIRRDLPNLTLSTEQNAKNWGSDDVSVMMNRVQAHGGQATYMRAMTDMAGAQHTVTFDFDEAVLGRSVAVFCAAAMELMGGKYENAD